MEREREWDNGTNETSKHNKQQTKQTTKSNCKLQLQPTTTVETTTLVI